MQLVRYDSARKALSEARAVDEVKDIRDKAQALCGFPLDPIRIHGDHIIHYSRGGSNHIVNKRLTCAICNLKRGANL